MKYPKAFVNVDPRTKDKHNRDKRWRVQYEDPDDGFKGKTKGGFRTKNEAQAWADEFKAKSQDGLWVDPVKGERTFQAVALDWLNSRSWDKANTRVGYERIIKGKKSLLNMKFGQVPIGNITHNAIALWVMEMRETKQPSTVRNNFYVLRKVMKYAVRERLIARDPSRGIEGLPAIPKVNHAEEGRYPLTTAQINKLVAALPEPWAMYARLVAATGLRPEEAVGLQLRHVDTEAGLIRVRQVWVRGRYEEPKTEMSKRTVKLDTATTRLLAAYIDAHRGRALKWFSEHEDHKHPGEDLPLFVGTASLGKGNHAKNAKPDIERLDFSRPINHTAFVTRYWKAVLKVAGVPESVRFYDLRHAHASLIAAQIGKPGALTLKECQERMGHANMATFYDRYVKSPEDLGNRHRNALDALWETSAATNVVPFNREA